MKLRVGDTVLITAGKDKGQKSRVVRVLPAKNAVIVEGVNMYTRHMRPQAGQPGDRVKKERPLPMAKVMIINDKGQPDRVGYAVGKDGLKHRIFKKTGTVISAEKKKAAKAKK